MSLLFLDSSFILALELKNDQNHQPAVSQWIAVGRRKPSLVTTSYVFAEIVTYLNSRGHHLKAVEAGNNVLQSPSVNFVHIDEVLFRRTWDYFQQHRDKGFSFADCASFVVMKELQITEVLTFDRHFSQAGFLIAR